jgi:membrane protein required for colicin V production
MHIVLAALVLLVALVAVQGWRYGVVRRALEVAGLLAVLLFAPRLADALRPRLASLLHVEPHWGFVLAWVLILLAGLLVVRVIAAAVAKLLDISVVGWLDHFGGAVLGAAFGLVLASCLLLALLASRVDDRLKRQVLTHPVTAPLVHVAPAVYDVTRAVWGGASLGDMARVHLEPALDRATSEVKAHLGRAAKPGAPAPVDSARTHDPHPPER